MTVKCSMKCNIFKYFQWTAHDTPNVWGSAPSLMVGCWCRQVSAGGHHEAWLWEVQHDEAGPCPVLPGQVWSAWQCSCPGMTSRKLIKQTDIMVIARDIKIFENHTLLLTSNNKNQYLTHSDANINTDTLHSREPGYNIRYSPLLQCPCDSHWAIIVINCSHERLRGIQKLKNILSLFEPRLGWWLGFLLMTWCFC